LSYDGRGNTEIEYDSVALKYEAKNDY